MMLSLEADAPISVTALIFVKKFISSISLSLAARRILMLTVKTLNSGVTITSSVETGQLSMAGGLLAPEPEPLPLPEEELAVDRGKVK